jgi:hypothetical protein
MYINIYILKKADPPVASAIFRMLHGRGRHEEVAGRCGNRFDRGLSLRGLIAPEQASARFGAPVADAAGRLFYRVTQSRHHRHRRDIPAHATMDTARHSSDCDGGLAGVRHDGAVFERRDPAGLSPACVGADRNHRRAGVATVAAGKG